MRLTGLDSTVQTASGVGFTRLGRWPKAGAKSAAEELFYLGTDEA